MKIPNLLLKSGDAIAVYRLRGDIQLVAVALEIKNQNVVSKTDGWLGQPQRHPLLNFCPTLEPRNLSGS